MQCRASFPTRGRAFQKQDHTYKHSSLHFRLSNKNWKVRAELYAELQNAYKQGDAERYAKYLIPMIQDSNPQAQTQALEVLSVYTGACDCRIAHRTALQNLELYLKQKAAGKVCMGGRSVWLWS